jgi:putative CocE/NonD family hydrolase
MRGLTLVIALSAAVLAGNSSSGRSTPLPVSAITQSEPLAGYVGVYAAPQNGEVPEIDRVSVAVTSGRLTIESDRNPPTVLDAKQADEFSLREPPMPIRFERDLTGKVVALSFAGSRLVRISAAPDRLFAGSNRPYVREDVEISMRDGVRLHTVIMRPEDLEPGKQALPFLIERTPYGTDGISARAVNATKPELAASGYVFVYQDIRGRGRSDGKFVMMRPPERARGRATAADETTDTWDTVDWLLKHVPGNNGRVGVTGMSYVGALALNAAIAGHPAIKAVAAQAPMVDVWMGDDFFHNGALRQSFVFDYAQKMEANHPDLEMTGVSDNYDFFLSNRNFVGAMAAVGMDHLPTAGNVIHHPNYDAFWRARALQRQLLRTNVPILLLGGWFDQEDMWGPQAAYRAIKFGQPKRQVHLVLGPWNHGGWAATQRNRGLGEFGAEPGEYYRKTIEAPFFERALKGRAGFNLRAVASFRTGANSWKFYDRWPPRSGFRPASLYLRSRSTLSFESSRQKPNVVATYLADPANPVPYQPRPIRPISGDENWKTWLLQDQRFLEDRSDIARFRGARLNRALTVTGDVIADLFASTTGTDADWIMKIIDVFPDGRELIVASEIVRARYRANPATPAPITPNKVEEYRWSLHGIDHVFLPGHQLMVTVQSSWFPLYDRNPQTFVAGIASAPKDAYKPQTIRILSNSRVLMSIGN